MQQLKKRSLTQSPQRGKAATKAESVRERQNYGGTESWDFYWSNMLLKTESLTQRAQRPQRKGGIEKNESRVFVRFMVSYDRRPKFLFPWRPLRTLRETSFVQLRCYGLRRPGVRGSWPRSFCIRIRKSLFRILGASPVGVLHLRGGTPGSRESRAFT